MKINSKKKKKQKRKSLAFYKFLNENIFSTKCIVATIDIGPSSGKSNQSERNESSQKHS